MQASIDEFYVDLSAAAAEQPVGSWLSFGEAMAMQLRSACTALGYTASAGVGPCKLLAKALATRAKPAGQRVLGAQISLQELLRTTPVLHQH